MADNTEKKAPDARKVSLYMPLALVEQVKEQAARCDRSFSFMIQKAWELSKNDIAKLPSDAG